MTSVPDRWLVVVSIYATAFDSLRATNSSEPSGVTANPVGAKAIVNSIGSPTCWLVTVL